jgi:lysozyme
MKYSKDGLHLTEQFEGCRLSAYQDSGGLWTIGYGHTAGVHPGMSCTQAQAEQWLAEDIAWAESQVNRLVRVALTQDEFDALVDFTFNCGVGNFIHSTLLALVNAGKMDQAAKEFERWDKAGGVVVAGLLRRRIAEEAEFR